MYLLTDIFLEIIYNVIIDILVRFVKMTIRKLSNKNK